MIVVCLIIINRQPAGFLPSIWKEVKRNNLYLQRIILPNNNNNHPNYQLNQLNPQTKVINILLHSFLSISSFFFSSVSLYVSIYIYIYVYTAGGGEHPLSAGKNFFKSATQQVKKALINKQGSGRDSAMNNNSKSVSHASTLSGYFSGQHSWPTDLPPFEEFCNDLVSLFEGMSCLCYMNMYR